ncbi:MAG: hypothetical protein R3B57_12595 [Phycisphaerales bacterium]
MPDEYWKVEGLFALSAEERTLGPAWGAFLQVETEGARRSRAVPEEAGRVAWQKNAIRIPSSSRSGAKFELVNKAEIVEAPVDPGATASARGKQKSSAKFATPESSDLTPGS